ncbi:MAG: thioesterase domain-containing protein, partial [Woeseiaceae bacterium]
MSSNTENQFYEITTKSKLESQLIALLDQKLGLSIEDLNTPVSFSTNIALASLIDTINQAFNIKLNHNLIQQKSLSEIADFMILETKAKSQNMVMPLNIAKGKPPLYFICGITLYSPLAKKLSENFSCYGIYVPQEEHFFKHDADKQNSTTIPYLAAHYVEAIVKHVAENTPNKVEKPVIAVAGVSFGGILAFEIARQLMQKEYKVSGLVILDAILPGALTRPLSLTAKLAFKKIKSFFTRRSSSASLPAVKVSAREQRKVALWKIIQGKAVQTYFKSLPTFNGTTLIIRAADQLGHNIEPSL